jgi:hypothetical protein
VTVEENANEIRVEVKAAGGAYATRTIADSAGAIDEALVATVAELAGRTGVALLGVTEANFEDNRVVTVLLRSGEIVASGSAIQLGGRPYALAQATWKALENHV